MNRTLLKKAAIQSVALMMAVVTLSYALHQYQTVTISASDMSDSESASASEETSVSYEVDFNTSDDDMSQSLPLGLDNEMQGNDTDPQHATFNELMNRADTDIISQMCERYLVIKKPMGDNVTFQLEDLYVTKSIRILLTGLTRDVMDSSSIGRVNNGGDFVGDPLYTESITPGVVTEEGTSEPVITKDYGNDLVHGITITTQYNEVTKHYNAELLIELNSVYAHVIHEDEEYYYIDLRKVQEVYDKVLVIDAGHGGKDGGALSHGEKYFEKNINLDILLQLKELLDKENIKVYYTRTADDKVFLRPREELANAVDCDFFISIHNNASEATWPNGTEILYCDTEFKGVKAKDLAEIMKTELGKTISLEQRGLVKEMAEDIFILQKAIVPAVIIEVGYMTNNNDMDYLSSSENRKAVAQGIYNGIMKAYETFNVANDGK